MEPDWVEHAIWWHLHPLSFVGAESDSTGVELTHRLRRIVDWFDYAVELGVSGIALGPVFVSRTHGYDTTDHFRIDPRLICGTRDVNPRCRCFRSSSLAVGSVRMGVGSRLGRSPTAQRPPGLDADTRPGGSSSTFAEKITQRLIIGAA